MKWYNWYNICIRRLRSPTASPRIPCLNKNYQKTHKLNRRMLILKNWLAATKDTSHIIYVVCVVVYLLNTTTYTAYAPPLMITITQTISLYIHIRTWLHCLTFIHKHSHFLMHTNTLMYVQTLMLTPQHNCLLKLNHRILFITIYEIYYHIRDRTKWSHCWCQKWRIMWTDKQCVATVEWER
jgi:hypothetical protein